MAARIMPGVQIPHCAPPCSRKACCNGCRCSLATPSIVRMSVPSACNTGTRQLFTSAPSISTEHAPHSPSPQPSFVPVSFNCSRSTSSSRAIGYASRVTLSPFTSHRTETLRASSDMRAFQCLGRHRGQHFEQRFRGNRNLPHVRARGVRNRIRNRRRRAVERQFADALRARRPPLVRNLLEENSNRRQIHGSRHHIIGHLRVGHAPFLPHYIFVESEADALRHAAFDLPRRAHLRLCGNRDRNPQRHPPTPAAPFRATCALIPVPPSLPAYRRSSPFAT